MIINLGLFIVFELASGFCNTLPQFLGVRSLYGIAMGGRNSSGLCLTLNLTTIGLFGPAAATALEDLPYDARGLLSGLFEQGYAVGYLLASVFYRAVSLESKKEISTDWRYSWFRLHPMGGGRYSGSVLFPRYS
jgi:SHS family lactate transporter-like MFS transporter